MSLRLNLVLASALALVASAFVNSSYGRTTEVADTTAPAALTVENFVDPPNSVKPWCYYWQLKGNVSKELITRDLENMAKIGFGGLLVFDSRRYWDDYDSKTHVPVPLEIKREFMSKEWRETASWLVSEADRLGLQVSFNISDSGGQLRGPWDMKELGPYELVWTEGNVDGPKTFSAALPAPDDKPYYRDVAFYAVRIATPVSSGREAVRLNENWGAVVLPSADSPRYDKLVRLDEFVRDGRLEWDVPEGHWKILRFGAARIGEPGCVDILNARSVADYFDKTPGTILDDVGALAGKTLTHFYNVSWEGVHPNWTDGFDEFFAERRRYSIYDNLPILRGLAPTGDGAVAAERFVEDYMKTISDAFRVNCYETIGELCHERGVRWHSEDGGPWNRRSPLFCESDMLSFWGQNDFPQGEFWIGSPTMTNSVYAAMAAHIYGRRDVALEAFTHMNKHWSVYPALLKPYADANYVAGANFMIWHTYTASPEELGKPGFEYFAGSHVNSNVTWQPYVYPFLRYMARCQQMLRQGTNVADICVYMSDKNYETWGNGEKWNPDSRLELPEGYRYDLLDTPVLVDRLEYRDGVFSLPGGAEYRLLVFDPNSDAIPAAAIRKIRALAAAGAPVLLGDRRPTRSVGLTDWRDADREVRELAESLWSEGGVRVFKGVDAKDALDALGVKPDFEGAFRYARRSTDDADLYFLAGDGADDCVFRVSDKKASIWDPMTGRVVAAKAVATEDGRTKVSIALPKNGATFVVFSNRVEAQEAELPRTRERLYTLTTPWKVAFDPRYGGPAETTFDRLALWNESDDPGVKFYSGAATYSTEFELTSEQASRELVLTLGEVHDIASVRLNGKELGVVWTDPWEIALGDAPRVGKNALEIVVVNCWRNRLVGDAGLEPEKRFTKTNVVLEKEAENMPAYRGYVSTDPLAPSGLLGPVAVEAIGR